MVPQSSQQTKTKKSKKGPVQANVHFLPPISVVFCAGTSKFHTDLKVFGLSRLTPTKGPQGLQTIIIQISILIDHKKINVQTH